MEPHEITLYEMVSISLKRLFVCMCLLFYSIYLNKTDELHVIVVGNNILFDLTKNTIK